MSWLKDQLPHLAAEYEPEIAVEQVRPAKTDVEAELLELRNRVSALERLYVHNLKPGLSE